MSNPPFPPVPPVPDGDDPEVPTREVDGETVLDPDADEDRIDSASADRVASGDDDAP